MKKALLILLAALSLLAGGCIERRDINQLSFVLGAIFDYDPAGQNYELHVQIAKTAAFSKGQTTQDPENFLIFKGQGKAVFEAVRDITKNATKRLFWAHCDVYVVGENLARRGILELLDFITRDNETREGSYIFVSAAPPDQLITIKDGGSKVPLAGLKQTADLGPTTHATTFRKKISDCWEDLSSPGKAFLIPLVNIKMPEVKAGEAHNHFQLSGAAVFKGDKMVGTLTPEETRDYLFLTNQLKDTVIPVTIRGIRVTLELISAEAKLKPVIDGENISFSVEVKTFMNYGSVEKPVNLQDLSFIKETEQAFNQEIENQILNSLNKSIDMKADYYNLGREVQLADPGLWREIKDRWADDYFPYAAFDVKVNSLLGRTGLLITTKPGEIK